MTAPAKKAPPPPKPSEEPAAAPNPVIVGEFPIGRGSMCQLIRVHGSKEHTITTKTLRLRGQAIEAHMGITHGTLLFKFKENIPPDLSKLRIIFPNWTNQTGRVDDKDDGSVRFLEMWGVTWWCVMKYPDVRDWSSEYVLARFGPLQLPPPSSAIH